jgi:hypothetical protein
VDSHTLRLVHHLSNSTIGRIFTKDAVCKMGSGRIGVWDAYLQKVVIANGVLIQGCNCNQTGLCE